MGQYLHQVGRGQNGIGYASALRLCPLQVDIKRFSQPVPCCNSSVNIVNALDSYSSRQVLMQMAMNSIQEFDNTKLGSYHPVAGSHLGCHQEDRL